MSLNKVKLKCKMCSSYSCQKVCEFLVLRKYKSNLIQCNKCNFNWLSNSERWLEEAYDESICITDTGIVSRSIFMSKFAILFLFFSNTYDKIIDWGAGSGLFVRLLRDQGFSCIGYEPYGPSQLAAAFCYKKNPLKKNNNYDIVFATEVLEHVHEPRKLMDDILKNTQNLIFTTQLISKNQNMKKWWYISNDLGQHISFQSERSLQLFCESRNLYYAFNTKLGIHIISKERYSKMLFKILLGKKRVLILSIFISIIQKIINKNCSVQKDFEICSKKIKN